MLPSTRAITETCAAISSLPASPHIVTDVERADEQCAEHYLEQHVDRPRRTMAVAREVGLERLLHRPHGAVDQPLPHLRVGLVLTEQPRHGGPHRGLRQVAEDPPAVV